MKKREQKLGRAAHIKKHTVGTSNEISFSVLDAAKDELEGALNKEIRINPSFFGHITLFTVARRKKKTVATPTKERGLPLSNGGFASVDDPSPSTSLKSAGGVISGSDLPKASEQAPRSTGKTSETKTREPLFSLEKPSQSSPKASKAKPAVSPEEEIARRKARRRLHRIVAACITILIGLGLAGAGGWYLYQDHQKYMGQVSQLDAALTLVRQADETVVALDGIMADPLSSDSLSAIDGVLAAIPDAAAKLEEADVAARSASVELRESKDKEAANQAVAAIAARKTMLKYGAQVAQLAKKADDGAEALRKVWKDVIKADSLARDAAALVVDTTDEHVSASKSKTQEAIAFFEKATAALNEVAAAHPEVNLASQQNYLAKRLEAMGYAVASDDAFLAKNKQEAVAQNDAYNRADSEAVALAKNLPSDAGQPAFDAFEVAAADMLDEYSTSRSQAGTADAFIRDYLGTLNK